MKKVIREPERGIPEICEAMREQLRSHLRAESELHFLMDELLSAIEKSAHPDRSPE